MELGLDASPLWSERMIRRMLEMNAFNSVGLIQNMRHFGYLFLRKDRNKLVLC